MTGGTWAVVPIKALVGVKSRLASVLDDAARADFVKAMARDVLAALKSVTALDGIAVVTHDPAVAALAKEEGVAGLDDSAASGLSSAIALAGDALKEKGAGHLLVILADTPRLKPHEIEAALHAYDSAPGPSLVLAPSRDGDGSNLMIFAPSAFKLAYGPGSAAAHEAAAKEAGLAVIRLHLEGAGHDLDTPQDFEDLLDVMDDLGPGSFTRDFLTSHGKGGPLGGKRETKTT